MTTRDVLQSIAKWLAGHWGMTMLALVVVIAIQQVAIWGLQRQLSLHESVAVAEDASGDGQQIATSPEGGDTAIDLKDVDRSVADDRHSNTPFLLVVTIMAVLVWGYWHMKRNAIFPVGLFVWGRAKSTSDNGIAYSITVRNWSTKSIEVSQPMINFMVMTGVRKFRASVNDLPMTLQPGTKYETTINLTGLIARNVELSEARGIGMSIMVNDRKHTTLPWPVKIQAGQQTTN